MDRLSRDQRRMVMAYQTFAHDAFIIGEFLGDPVIEVIDWSIRRQRERRRAIWLRDDGIGNSVNRQVVESIADVAEEDEAFVTDFLGPGQPPVKVRLRPEHT